VKRDIAELIQVVLTIGAHLPLESIGVGDCEERHCLADPDGAYHWSPLESIGVGDWKRDIA
jgi:hypothetical protein